MQATPSMNGRRAVECDQMKEDHDASPAIIRKEGAENLYSCLTKTREWLERLDKQSRKLHHDTSAEIADLKQKLIEAEKDLEKEKQRNVTLDLKITELQMRLSDARTDLLRELTLRKARSSTSHPKEPELEVASLRPAPKPNSNIDSLSSLSTNVKGAFNTQRLPFVNRDILELLNGPRNQEVADTNKRRLPEEDEENKNQNGQQNHFTSTDQWAYLQAAQKNRLMALRDELDKVANDHTGGPKVIAPKTLNPRAPDFERNPFTSPASRPTPRELTVQLPTLSIRDNEDPFDESISLQRYLDKANEF